jgi:hypothetical protein
MVCKKNIYLHIGIGKTGTTAIQNFLYLNRSKFKKLGFVYPMVGIENKAHHYLGNGWGIGWMTEKQLSKVNIPKLWAKIRKNFLKGKKNFIISAETLSRVFQTKPEAMKQVKDEYLKDCSIKIIVYLRRQDLHAQSWQNQRIKVGWTSEKLNPETPLPGVYQYHRYLLSIANIFGKENIIVRPFEKCQFRGGTIFSDFLQCIGLDINEYSFEFPQTNPNPRLNRDTMEILRISNSIERPWEQKYQFNLVMQELLKDDDNERIFHEQGLLTYEESNAILSRFEESNQKTAIEFLRRDNGILFKEPIKAKSERIKAYPGLDQKIVVKAMIKLFERLNG